MKITKLSMVCICVTILFGCSSETIQNNPISQKATKIRTMVNQFQWDKAKQEAKLIEKSYIDDKWKYQLLGDETEYNKLDEHITKLKVSLEERDKTEAKLNIGMIEHYIESLYFK